MHIAQKILLLGIASSLIVVGASIYLSYTFTKVVVQQVVTARQLEIANQVLDKMDRFLSERSGDIQMIANSHLLQMHSDMTDHATTSVENDLDLQIRRELVNVSVMSGSWDMISIFGIDGETLSSSLTQDVINGPDQEPQVNIAMEHALRGEPYYSDVFYASSTGKPTMIFSYPVRRLESPDRQIIGVTVGFLSWPAVLEFLQNPTYHMDLLNSEGLFLGDNDFSHFDHILKENYRDRIYAKRALVGEDGAYEGDINDEFEQEKLSLISYSSEKGFLNYRGNNWTLVVSTPVEDAYAIAVNAARNISLLLFFVIASGMAIFLFFILHALRPIQELTRISNQIAAGDLSQRLHFSSHDEFGILARSFNMMASTLQDLYRGLEEKIAEKTAELQEEKYGVELKVVERTQQLADEQRRLEASINSLSVGYILTGVDNSIILINTRVKEIFLPIAIVMQKEGKDRPLEDMHMPITYLQLALGGALDIFEKIEQVKQTKTRLLTENVVLGAFTLVFHFTPIVNEETKEYLGTVILIEDISERKILERSRDEFFSIASHELRTPLTAIRGNVSILQEYFIDQIKDKEVETIITDIQESSERLIEIVNIFLDVSRLEQGKIVFEKEAFDLVELSESIVQEYAMSMTNKELYLRVRKPDAPLLSVYADRNRVRQVIINLIGNALKFTEQGGVEISFLQMNGSVKLLVSDTGSGISPENQTLLFRKFQQAETNIYRRDTTRGTGLGLYISKMLINNMGGSIFIERSEEGKGSVFGITVPDVTAREQ